MRARAVAFAAAALLAFAGTAAGAEPVDWSRWADQRTVEVVTTDDSGETRTTTVWIVVVDGQGYVRTGDTRWGKDVAQRPELVLRVGGQEIPRHVAFVEEDEDERAAVNAAFREKYGFQDRALGVFRGRPKIMRLEPPAEDAAESGGGTQR